MAEIVPLSPAFQAFVSRQPVAGLLHAPPIVLEPAQRVALLRGQALSLTATEFELLTCLVANAGQVVSHQALEAHVWHEQYIEDPERLKTAIKTLRNALGQDDDCIQNVRGQGYRFLPIP
jgi:DNA-binding response OmpR family regulator